MQGTVSVIAAASATGTATLIAASIAAVAAIASLVVNTVANRRAESRAVHRDLLKEHISQLGEAIHEVVALSSEQHKALTRSGPRRATKLRESGIEKARQLDRLRRKVRYPLDGLNDGLRNLARLPSWIAHLKGNERGRELLTEARALADELHGGIAESWRRGKPPPDRRRKAVDERVRALRVLAPIGKRPDVDVDAEVDAEVQPA